ncbi:hypothetical protein WQ54_01780 [Bacillus sp. SA1-12]|nr:hypothetical protein WQ54_01780 [Bacillus sp. SA1-12]
MGLHTVPIFIGVLLIGFAYSLVLMFTKKGMIGAIINIYVIGILVLGSSVIYLLTIAAGV